MSDLTELKREQFKYVCLDIFEFTKRTNEDQFEILKVLKDKIRRSLEKNQIAFPSDSVVCLPTGDGICIALRGITEHDIHLRIALTLLEELKNYNDDQEKQSLKFDVRIGVHAHTDYLVNDINERDNIAGAGINEAFRIMSLADDKQILVGRRVFDNLSNDEFYKDAFKPFSVKIRHHVTMSVYQYVKQAVGLDIEIPKAIKQQNDEEELRHNLITPAKEYGLKRIFGSVYKETESLFGNIRKAEKRIWLMGLGDEWVDNPDISIVPTLKVKIERGVSVKILVLDALRSPALFRALLVERMGGIIPAARSGEQPIDIDPYLSSQPVESYLRAFRSLNEPAFYGRVRYFGHMPDCALAIVDDVAYFKPYTFGDVKSGPLRSQRVMPLFKFEKRPRTLETLKEHFRKLWLGSDTDLFHTGARIVAKQRILWEIYRKRCSWLEHSYGAIYKSKEVDNEDDERTYPRLPCATPPEQILVTIKPEQSEISEISVEEIVNLSRNGICIRLEKDVELSKGIIVKLNIKAKLPKRDEINYKSEIKYLEENFLKPADGRFVVVWAAPQSRLYGLQANKA